jgi:hypothetical protein
MKLLIFIITCYGITNIAIFGSIFRGWRKYWNDKYPKFWGKLFSCPMCLSFWIGIVLSTILQWTYNDQFSPFASYGMNSASLAVFLDGCFSSGIVWILHTAQEAMERSNPIEDLEDHG